MTKVLWMIFLILPVLFALTGCATSSALKDIESMPGISGAAGEENRPPRIILDAHPRVGFAPLRVTIKAMLQNVPENDPIFACIWESWSFGDGAISSEKSGCDGATAIVDLEHYAEHVYREEGLYEVRFMLGENQVLSNPVQIRVIGDGH
jgi:hypothetical protein